MKSCFLLSTKCISTIRLDSVNQVLLGNKTQTVSRKSRKSLTQKAQKAGRKKRESRAFAFPTPASFPTFA